MDGIKIRRDDMYFESDWTLTVAPLFDYNAFRFSFKTEFSFLL